MIDIRMMITGASMLAITIGATYAITRQEPVICPERFNVTQIIPDVSSKEKAEAERIEYLRKICARLPNGERCRITMVEQPRVRNSGGGRL